jgi:hypothetical protein
MSRYRWFALIALLPALATWLVVYNVYANTAYKEDLAMPEAIVSAAIVGVACFLILAALARVLHR